MVMLTGQKTNAQFVAACCARCAKHGVLPGMSVAHARALVPAGSEDELIVESHEPARDEAALKALANWAIRFTPLVAPDPPDGLLLDVTGCERLYGSEPALLDQLAVAFSRLRLRARLACASTISCAWAVARYGELDHAVIQQGDERDAISLLPIASLRLDDEICHGLHEVNIDRINQLIAIPRLELATRFDPMLLRRIGQALGYIDEVIEPIRPREPVVVERGFQGPVKNLEAILIASRELIANFVDELIKQEIGVTHVRFIFKRSDLPQMTLDLRLSHPGRDAKHLWTLLRPKIEVANMGFGIEDLTLSAVRTERMAHQQTASSFAPTSHNDSVRNCAAGMLIDTLSQRLGSERVLMADVRESHRPERVAERLPAMDSLRRRKAQAALVESDRPSILLARPERIEVMAITPDGPPIWMRWRGVARSLISTCGPERLCGEWWRCISHFCEDRRTRDYFKVQDETGQWLWVYRNTTEAGDSWFLHGIWA